MTYMDEEQIAARRIGRRERRPQTGAGHVGASEQQRGIDPSIEPFGPVHHLACDVLIDSQVPSAKMGHQVRERGDGEPAGGFTGAGATHAVSDDHPVAVLVEARGDRLVGKARHERFLIPAHAQDQIMILVRGAQAAAARRRAKLDLHLDRGRWRIARVANPRSGRCTPPSSFVVVHQQATAEVRCPESRALCDFGTAVRLAEMA